MMPTATAIATEIARRLMLRSGSRSPRIAGVIPKTFTPTAPISTPATPAEQAKQSRLPQHHANDPSTLPAECEQDANFLRALKHGHQHRVHHAEHTDEHRQQRSAPAHGLNHAVCFALANMLARHHGATFRAQAC